MSGFEFTLNMDSTSSNSNNTSSRDGALFNRLRLSLSVPNLVSEREEEPKSEPHLNIREIIRNNPFLRCGFFGTFHADNSIEDFEVNEKPKLINNVSRCISESTGILNRRKRDDINELPSSKLSKIDDPGYTGRKSMCILGKSLEYKRYTEDRSVSIKYTTPDGCVYIFMVVADGHSGSYKCAKIITAYMAIHFELIAKSLYVPGQELDTTDVLTRLFSDTQSYCNNNKDLVENSGSTCCACIISESTNRLTVANLGDSVCMVVSGDIKTFRTRDQDASSQIEQTRILDIDSDAQFVNRIDDPAIRLNGNLIPVGGFGDYRHDYPVGVIRRIPEITTHQLHANDHIILSTDGLYETFLPHGMIGAGRPDNNIVRLVSEYSQQINLQNNSLADYLFDTHVEEIANLFRDSGMYHPDTPQEVLIEYARKAKDNTVILVYKA